MFQTVPLSIIRSFSLYTHQWCMSYRFADSLRTGSGSWSCSHAVWHIPLLCVQWKTPDDGQRNCLKHVEFYSKNKFEKLVHLIVFIIRRHTHVCRLFLWQLWLGRHVIVGSSCHPFETRRWHQKCILLQFMCSYNIRTGCSICLFICALFIVSVQTLPKLCKFMFCSFRFCSFITRKGKGKAVPLQAWTGPEGSRKLRFPDFMTTAQDGGKVVSLTHRPPLPPGNTPGTHFC